MSNTFYDRVIELIAQKGISQRQLCRDMNIANGSVGKWRIHEPMSETLKALSKYFNVSETYLLNGDENGKGGVWIPVLGNVMAGIPIEAIEDIEDYESIPQSLARTGEFFGLKIRGNSMSPRLQDGDTVIVRKQEDADTNDIVIAQVNGDLATCKILKKHSTGITLVPVNPDYDPIPYTNQEILDLPVTILGKVVELRRKF